jgi:hypothetical protein
MFQIRVAQTQTVQIENARRIVASPVVTAAR